MSDANDTESVLEALRTVMDPELNLNVVDLGMIRHVDREEGRTVVSMVLTTMTCPFWELFIDQIKIALEPVEGVGEVEVRYDPSEPWNVGMLSDEARWQLEIDGLLPTHTWLGG